MKMYLLSLKPSIIYALATSNLGKTLFKMRPQDLPQLLKEAASEWIEDDAMRLSSSLAYYAVFSLGPLLVIVISIAGLVFGEEAARGQIAQQISALAGARAGEAIQAAVQASASEKTTGVLATIIGLVVLLFGASTVFAELKYALNTIWGVAVKPGRAFFTLVHDRFLSFSIVLAIGFLLLVSLVLSAVLAALGKYMSARLPLPAAV
jgi:membrane protein